VELCHIVTDNRVRSWSRGDKTLLAMRWRIIVALVLLGEVLGPPGALSQATAKKNVLILTEVGLSHPLTSVITQQIVAGVEETEGQHVEFYTESLDLLSFTNKPTLDEIEDWLRKKYGGDRLDVVVAIGPGVIRFLEDHKESLFKDVPIVICGSARDQAGNPRLDSRFTGTWQQREPAKTLEVALRLLPGTKQVFVVAGNSTFDQFILAETKKSLQPFESRLQITYLTDLRMGQVLQRLGVLPERSLVLYLSYFEDVDGKKFVNATKALPMVAAASSGPVFGMSDTYLGHGIVGGDVMNFQQQGRVTAQIVSQLLGSKHPDEVPIEMLPSQYMFDWKELRRWNIGEWALPSESIILFREPTPWERTKWIWLGALFIIVSLAALATYLQFSRKQLQLARKQQRRLSGMLINAGEKERRRIANELHDDFSQRLAVLALKLENVSELVAPLSAEAERQLRELLNSTSELGADLHSLSHRLHSSTLQSLGLTPAVSALCKEFSTQESVKTDFSAGNLPPTIHPDVALCAFRIVQEGLRNIKKHSGASSAKVLLHRTNGMLIVTVEDNGCGFDQKSSRGDAGLGLRAMEERASLLGGKLTISSVRGAGTLIEADIPLAPVVLAEVGTST